jgi:hypothetical protein
MERHRREAPSYYKLYPRFRDSYSDQCQLEKGISFHLACHVE